MLLWKHPKYSIINTSEQLDNLCTDLKKRQEKNLILAVDVETSSPLNGIKALDCFQGWVVGISLAVSKYEGFYIPLRHTDIEGNILSGQLSVDTVVSKLNPILSKGIWLGHNLKFDYKFLWKMGIYLSPRMWDTYIAKALLDGDSNKPKKLKSIITQYVNIPQDIIQTFSDVSEDNGADKVPIEKMAIYAINDCIFCFYLYEVLKPVIDEENPFLFYEVESPLISILAQSELQGTRIDVKYFDLISKKLKKHKINYVNFFKQHYNLDIGSSRQLADYFYNNYKDLDIFTTTKKGNISVDAKVLKKLVKRNLPKDFLKLIKRILKFRQIETTLTKYTEKIPKLTTVEINNNNIIHVLHTNFTQIINSGRLSSSPNIQNITKEGIVDVRKGFIPHEYYTFTKADWSGAELRILAIISKDKNLIKLYTDNPYNLDLHRHTAQLIFGKKDVSDSERRIAKTANFAIIYGITKHGLSNTLNCGVEEAQDIIDMIFKIYPGIKEYMDRSKKEVRNKRFTQTYFGRKRFLPENIYPEMEEKWLYESYERALVNHPIQGTCADLLKKSMVEVQKEISNQNLDAYIAANIHDELIIANKQPNELEKLLKKVMEVKIDSIIMPVEIAHANTFSKKDDYLMEKD